jgi:succinate dehydrogenase/fumarate reductase flavoprotein subunit
MMQLLMSACVGVLRDLDGLTSAERGLAELAPDDTTTPSTENWEATNLFTVARTLVHVARLREETRGSHWREDFPERDDEHWLGHLDTVLNADGELVSQYVPGGTG